MERLEARPNSPSTVYSIDRDGAFGSKAPARVYCDMELDGGGYQLVSVIGNADHSAAMFDAGNCEDPLVDSCFGHVDPLLVSRDGEVIVRAQTDGDWIKYNNFSASNVSALRYFSRERAYVYSSDGTSGNNVCGDAQIDPALKVAGTSGFPMQYKAPLYQFWRYGGWWVGAEPNAGTGAEEQGMHGRLNGTSYFWTHDIRSRANENDGATALVSNDTQQLFYRPRAR